MSKKRLRYSIQERLKLIDQIEASISQGGNAKQACEKLGVPPYLFYKWRRRTARGSAPIELDLPTVEQLKPGMSGGRMFALFATPDQMREFLRSLV